MRSAILAAALALAGCTAAPPELPEAELLIATNPEACQSPGGDDPVLLHRGLPFFSNDPTRAGRTVGLRRKSRT